MLILQQTLHGGYSFRSHLLSLVQPISLWHPLDSTKESRTRLPALCTEWTLETRPSVSGLRAQPPPRFLSLIRPGQGQSGPTIVVMNFSTTDYLVYPATAECILREVFSRLSPAPYLPSLVNCTNGTQVSALFTKLRSKVCSFYLKRKVLIQSVFTRMRCLPCKSGRKT